MAAQPVVFEVLVLLPSMETTDQRKFGYGGDGMPPDDGDSDGSWEPGGDGSEPSPFGLFILLAAGAVIVGIQKARWYLNPQTKLDLAQKRYEAQLAARKKRILRQNQQKQGGWTGTINIKP